MRHIIVSVFAYGSEKSFTTTDATAPTGSISINSNATYINSTTSATDNVGVTGYYVSKNSTTPSASASGWTTITSTTSYTEDISYTISSGDGNKTIYAWYKDVSGNVSSISDNSTILDTTPPTIIINSPTSSSTYSSSSNLVRLDGISFDYISGVNSVTWSNSNGESGTATGTTNEYNVFIKPLHMVNFIVQ